MTINDMIRVIKAMDADVVLKAMVVVALQNLKADRRDRSWEAVMNKGQTKGQGR